MGASISCFEGSGGERIAFVAEHWRDSAEFGAGTASPAVGGALRRLILVGNAGLARELRARLPSHWHLTVVAPSPEISVADGSVDVYPGDGTSAVVLERAGVAEARVVIAALTDQRANLEVCRLARERFAVPQVLTLVDSVGAAEAFGELGVETVVASAAMATALRNRLERSSLALEGVGLGEGEILQITLHPSSPAIGRALRSFSPQDWTVASVFREGRLLIPHGDTVLAAGDRLLLIGLPQVLPAVGEYLRLGRTRFPLPYGTDVLALADGELDQAAREELEQLAAAARLSRIVVHVTVPDEGGSQGPGAAGRLVLQRREGRALDVLPELLRRRECGCLCLVGSAAHGPHRPGRDRLLRAATRQTDRPVLLLRRSAPYRRILFPLASEIGSRAAADVAFDLSEIMQLPLTVLTIAAAAGDGEHGQSDWRWFSELADERRRPIENDKVVGNPLRQVLQQATRHDLAVLGVTKPGRAGLLRPEPLVYLAERLPGSTMIVPDTSR